jgi:TolA-binding protein
VFKDVGLQEKADDKAEEGLAKVDEVIKIAVDSKLPQGTIEEVLNTKWDLLLVQNKLREAVDVCNALLRLYPDSQIADRALLQIGKAKLTTNYVEEWRDSIKVFSAVLGLQKSELKAEAQFRLAQAQEKVGMARQKNAEEKTIPQAAIVAYQRCANTYPESAYAGKSLEKVVQYYIETEDFQRAADLMEMVFQDFVDASFLDVMLLKWAIAAQKMGDTELARAKLNQLIAEYPNSKVVGTAIRFKEGLE